MNNLPIKLIIISLALLINIPHSFAEETQIKKALLFDAIQFKQSEPKLSSKVIKKFNVKNDGTFKL